MSMDQIIFQTVVHSFLLIEEAYGQGSSESLKVMDFLQTHQ